MATLRLRAPVARDLADILEYGVRNHGRPVAEAYLAAIGEAFERLRQFPQLGEPRAEYHPQMRSIRCREHRIYYVYAAGHVSVYRILHHAQDVRRWLP